MGISWLFTNFLDFGLLLCMERGEIIWKSGLFHRIISLRYDNSFNAKRNNFTRSNDWLVILYQTRLF